MAQLDLTSHHVNYLIWRYLQESGHGEAAVSLQRAWFPDPQSLPFAPYIKTHALVSLVQKGLQYRELESSIDKEGNTIPAPPSEYFFGPEPFEPTSLKTPERPPGRRAVNGHVAEAPIPGKKVRIDRDANGDESMDQDVSHEANESKPDTPVPEQIDGDGDVSMEADEVPPEPTFTLTSGSSIGVQMTPAKAADLAPDTTLLDVADDHVTRTLWRPRDPTVVVTAGDTFCSLWKLSLSSAPVPKSLISFKGGDSCVSAVAWDAVGEKLAVATYSELRGAITMYDVNGDAVDLLPELPRMITGLHWAPDGSQLIVVASDNRTSELALWDDTHRPDVYPPPQRINSPVYDLAWCGRNQVFACGNGSVYQCEVDQSIRLTNTFTSGASNAAWEFIRCVQTPSASVAVAACSETASIWIPTHDMHIDKAHQGEITAIEIRPQEQTSRRNSSIVLASYSTDDSVKVWQVDLEAKQFGCLHRLFLGPSTPALAGGFSPDGYALGAVSKDRLFIWNVERGGNAMATWSAPASSEVKKEETDRATNGQNGHSGAVSDRALSWDADGKRLAYGFGHQMAIVNLQR
ncbi:hypothetical protein N7510_009269 [Penicillium lagena]|uniref:uncharacterized protein n=1 Tax=Penicillium lagena TaxID=94218 RepID=UPI00254070B3|nr:uncharacterized protein N7510_009269 [Penicillium lagena]KAJ5606488.1 hypothetical protein N7510_009269 [Penicillium lagena]